MKQTRWPKGLVAASSAAVLLALAGCDREPVEQETAVVPAPAAPTAEVRQEAREAGAQVRQEGREAGQAIREGAAEARQETREATAEARQETREATAEARQETREATAEARQEGREAAASAESAAMGAGAEARQAGREIASTANDMQITTQVNARLAADSDLSAMKIDVDTENGVVTLRGTAPSAVAKEKAAEIARKVEDVRSVRNELTVRAG